MLNEELWAGAKGKKKKEINVGGSQYTNLPMHKQDSLAPDTYLYIAFNTLF